MSSTHKQATKTWDMGVFVFCFTSEFVLGLSDLGVDPRALNDILYFCKSPAAAVSPGVLMVQLKEQCSNQDVCAR